jgi:hypothetical protein
MKAKKTAPPRRRISFAVDRDEIEINSDWVEAVMAAPTAAAVAPSVPPQTTVDPFPAPPQAAQNVAPPSLPPSPAAEEVFLGPGENNTTGTDTATGAQCTPVENRAPVENCSSVVQNTPVKDIAPVEENSTVVNNATDSATFTDKIASKHTSKPQNSVPVAGLIPVAQFATGELLASTRDHRLPLVRPLLRVTDGLTPGQYAVYSLMYEAGESAGGPARIYKGGYADLRRLTGLSKRGLQNIVAELQTKQVIGIHQQPGYHRNETTAYVVPNTEAVLQGWLTHGWRHASGKSKLLLK